MRPHNPLGAVRSRSVAVVTRDAALYADLVSILRENRVPNLGLLPGDRIPDRVAAVLTSPEEAPEIRHPRLIPVRPETDRTALLVDLRTALDQPTSAGEILFGIDPGPTPGFAVLSAGTVLAEGSLRSPEAVVSLVRQTKRQFPNRTCRVRVGLGDPASRRRIVNSLWPLHLPMELVDERGTTPRGHRRPRDAVAARSIARTPGRTATGPEPLRITPGEIANLQRLSRITSGGSHTISRHLASQVLEGTLTLAEAVEVSRPSARPTAGRRSVSAQG